MALDIVDGGVAFEPCDDATVGVSQAGPPAKIVIAKIKDVGSTWLDLHFLGRGDVVHAGRSKRKIDRLVGARII
jgi:hypothetical protein